MTQEDVAKRVGMSRQQYMRIEQGLAVPGRTQAMKLTEILDTAVLHGDQLFTDRERRAAASYTPYRLETVSQEPWRVFEQTQGVASGVDRAT
jgi:transcriptional regulator with XRE-family HTH domain